MFYEVKKHSFIPDWFISLFKLVLVFTVCFCYIPVSHAELKGEACMNKPPLKVAVLSAGLQKNTVTYFTQILKRLGADGFVAENEIPKTVDLRNKAEYKKYISDGLKGKCLEFPPELGLFYNWEASVLKDAIDDLALKAAKKEVDVVFALGDLATKFMIEDELNIPVISFDTNSTEILKTLAGEKKNVVILDDSRNIKDDIELFHTMFGYTGFGYLRDKNHIYDLYNAFDEVNHFAKKKNFQIKVCEGAFFVPDLELSRSEFSRCMVELSNQNISAVFLPEVGNGIDMANFYSQIRPLLTKKIPAISYDSKSQVEAGSLLSVYDPDEFTRAAYAADIIEDLVLNGFDFKIIAEKRELAVPLFFGVNLKTAAIVQWRPAFDVLVAVDDIFHTIKSK
jgi:hypothetical protein